MIAAGLSPLARGTLALKQRNIVATWFIPASAGNTFISSRTKNLLPVYPR
ncbi:hypothetical protein AA98_3122 [Escherichia coli 2-011-08_S1_C1]|nr:hypothetical protein AA98_3122 [Escherichia coli 2-011-08_S1_C1]